LPDATEYLADVQIMGKIPPMTPITAVVTAFLAAMFMATGAAKLAGLPRLVATRDRLGVTARSWLSIGALEIAGAAGALLGLAVRPLGLAATGGLVLVAAGAIAAHVRAGDEPLEAAPAGVALTLASAALALQAVTA
jgi:DoxX-like family